MLPASLAFAALLANILVEATDIPNEGNCFTDADCMPGQKCKDFSNHPLMPRLPPGTVRRICAVDGFNPGQPQTSMFLTTPSPWIQPQNPWTNIGGNGNPWGNTNTNTGNSNPWSTATQTGPNSWSIQTGGQRPNVFPTNSGGQGQNTNPWGTTSNTNTWGTNNGQPWSTNTVGNNNPWATNQGSTTWGSNQGNNPWGSNQGQPWQPQQPNMPMPGSDPNTWGPPLTPGNNGVNVGTVTNPWGNTAGGGSGSMVSTGTQTNPWPNNPNTVSTGSQTPWGIQNTGNTVNVKPINSNAAGGKQCTGSQDCPGQICCHLPSCNGQAATQTCMRREQCFSSCGLVSYILN